MNEDNLKELVTQGLLALKSAGEVGTHAAAETANDASDPSLKTLLSEGSKQAEEWQRKIERALDEAGAGGQSKDNPIIQAHYEVSKRIRAEAKSPETRDLGIVAAGQLVMHYYIAAYGTLHAYAGRLGMDETRDSMRTLLEEAKATDERMTRVAEAILGAGAGVGNPASMR